MKRPTKSPRKSADTKRLDFWQENPESVRSDGDGFWGPHPYYFKSIRKGIDYAMKLAKAEALAGRRKA